MKTLPTIAAFFLTANLFAQDLAAELAPLVAQYKADVAAIESQKVAALARVEQPYLAALENVEKAASTAGNLNVVAALNKERESLKSGLMAPAIPADLPKSLSPTRKIYLDGLARVSADVAARQKSINAEHLRKLTALQLKAARNPELAKQIASEKEQLIASVAAATSGAQSAGSARNSVINGGFDLAEADGLPKGWKTFGRVELTTAQVVRDGSNAVLRVIVAGPVQSLGVMQMIPVPERAKTMTVSGRIRGKLIDARKDDSNHGANISARQIAADKKEIAWTLLRGGVDAGWKSFKDSAPIRSGAKEVELSLVNWWVAGTFDFDEITVEFH